MKKYLLLILLLIPMSVDALDVKSGKFTYTPAFEEPVEEKYYYRDEYFMRKGTKDNQHLLTMSYNLALSTFEVSDTTYITELYNETGFKKITPEGITDNTIGTIIATKKIDKYDLVAVAIRGGQYKTEWTNNFIAGLEGNANGFNDSSKIVIKRIKEYIKKNKLKNVKLWIVGYSRGGAIANLTGIYINENLKQFKTTTDDLYVYTFEAPAVSTDKTKYDNIYNVVNKNDIVPFAYPEEWGFYNNGKLIEIGEDEEITLTSGVINNKEIKEIKINKFLNDYFTWLAGNLSRETYYNELEEPITSLSKIFFGKSVSEREKIYNFFANDLASSLILDFEFQNEFLNAEMLELMYENNYLYDDLTDAIIYKLDILKESKDFNVLTDEEYEIVKESLYPLIRTLGPIIYKDYIDEQSFYHTKTLFKNIEKIVINHYPQTNIKIIQNLDSFYGSKTMSTIINSIVLLIFIGIFIKYNSKK